jgi:hypothetical protein
VRVFGCLSWFDENPRWLAATVASFAKIADHVIALDGAFFHYPEGRPASGGEQAELVMAVARANGMGCTVHVPRTVWMGNEVEKRDTYARLAGALGTAGEDWILVLDGDEEITEVSPLTRRDLEETDLHAAQIGFWTDNELESWYGPTRRMYRLLPGLSYGPAHYTVRGLTETGTVFVDGRGPDFDEPVEPALDLTAQIRVEHKHHLREQARTEKADVFAAARVDYDLEGWRR